MIRQSRRFLLLAILIVVSTALAGAAPEVPASSGGEAASEAAQAPDISGLETPRETFRTFLTAMVDGRERAAMRTLDLSGIPAPARSTRGVRVVNRLYQILNRLGYVEYETIPETLPGDSYVYHTWVEDTYYIELTRGSDGAWRFSGQTVDQVDAMWDLVRDQEQLAGQTVAFAEDPDLWMDENLPRWLTRTDFILRNYQWMTMLLLIFLGVVADRFFRAYVRGALEKILANRRVQYEEEYLPRAAKWMGLTVAGVIWIVGVEALNLPEAMILILGVAARFLAVAAGVLAALAVTDLISSIFVIKAKRTETKFDDILVPLIRKAVKFFIGAIGIVFIADNMRVDITSLLAGLGIGGLAFALAAKDTIENLFGSITILIDRPFQIGDWVRIGEVEGTVEVLGMRSTRIRTFYNSLITVPNSNLIKANVDNLGMRRYRRISTMINVTYNTPPEKLDAFCEGIRELIRQHPYTWKNNYHVWLNQFGSHSLDILLYCFHETPDWATELRERHRLMLDIVRLARRIGIEFAFPTQTLYLERGSGPARPDTKPFATHEDVERVREGARGDVEEMVDRLLRADGLPYPPPPVAFQQPLEWKQRAIAPRNRGGDAGAADSGGSSAAGGSGEGGGR